MEETGVALGKGKDNYDGPNKIDTDLVLNKKKKEAQFFFVNYICFL